MAETCGAFMFAVPLGVAINDSRRVEIKCILTRGHHEVSYRPGSYRDDAAREELGRVEPTRHVARVEW